MITIQVPRCAETYGEGETRCYYSTQGHPRALDGVGSLMHRSWREEDKLVTWKTMKEEK